jgi:hypothetical protein
MDGVASASRKWEWRVEIDAKERKSQPAQKSWCGVWKIFITVARVTEGIREMFDHVVLGHNSPQRDGIVVNVSQLSR